MELLESAPMIYQVYTQEAPILQAGALLGIRGLITSYSKETVSLLASCIGCSGRCLEPLLLCWVELGPKEIKMLQPLNLALFLFFCLPTSSSFPDLQYFLWTGVPNRALYS